MNVKKEASGRRSIQVEVEVPGTPEEVWQAIASGPSISSCLSREPPVQAGGGTDSTARPLVMRLATGSRSDPDVLWGPLVARAQPR